MFIVYFVFFTCKLLIIRHLNVNNDFILLFYCLQIKFILLTFKQLGIK